MREPSTTSRKPQIPVATNLKGCVEYDGYDGIALATCAPVDRGQESLGFMNRKDAFWSAVYRF